MLWAYDWYLITKFVLLIPSRKYLNELSILNANNYFFFFYCENPKQNPINKLKSYRYKEGLSCCLEKWIPFTFCNPKDCYIPPHIHIHIRCILSFFLYDKHYDNKYQLPKMFFVLSQFFLLLFIFYISKVFLVIDCIKLSSCVCVCVFCYIEDKP